METFSLAAEWKRFLWETSPRDVARQMQNVQLFFPFVTSGKYDWVTAYTCEWHLAAMLLHLILLSTCLMMPFSLDYSSTLKMEPSDSFASSVYFQWTPRRHISYYEEWNLFQVQRHWVISAHILDFCYKTLFRNFEKCFGTFMQIPYNLICARTRADAAGSRRLTAWQC
jgi:hypothetical protein